MDDLFKISELIDGNLDMDLEQEVFAKLATSEELRKEFRQFNTIKTAVLKDKAAYIPDIDATNSLFTKIGFDSALIGDASIAPTMFLSKFIQFLSSTILGVIIAFLLFRFGDFDYLFNNSQNINSISSVVEIQELKKEVPMVESIADTINLAKNTSDLPQKISKVYMTNPTDQQLLIDFSQSKQEIKRLNEIINALNKKLDIANSAISETRLISSEVNKLRLQSELINLNSTTLPTIDFISPLDIEFEKANRVSIELGGNQPYNFQNEVAQPAQPQLLNNTRLAAFYKLSDDVQVGLEYRRGNFYQIYNSENEAGRQVVLEQNPNLEFYTVALRYKPDFAEFGSFSPFAQFSIGGTKVGEVAYSMLGIEWSLSNNYYMYGGVDYNYLRFFHNDIFYSSNKFGLHFGLGLNF